MYNQCTSLAYIANQTMYWCYSVTKQDRKKCVMDFLSLCFGGHVKMGPPERELGELKPHWYRDK